MVDEVQDLNARFSRVFIGLKPTGTRKRVEPKFVDSFWEDDNGNIIVRLYDRQKEQYKEVKWVEKDYILDCPQVGMISDGEKVYYASRSPQRQWKRGYTPNVVHLELLSQRESREMNLITKGITSPEITLFAYNPEYTSLSDGLSSMKRGEVFSFPLSRKFAIGQKAGSKYPVIYYKSWIVGWAEGEILCLPENCAHLFEELSQYAVCRRV